MLWFKCMQNRKHSQWFRTNQRISGKKKKEVRLRSIAVGRRKKEKIESQPPPPPSKRKKEPKLSVMRRQ